MSTRADEAIWFDQLGRADVALVGGKNASLGEMVRHLGERGVAVPPGFATAAQAFWHFIDSNQLRDVIATTLQDMQAGRTPLPEAGQTIRRAVLRGEWPKDTAAAIGGAYKELCRRVGKTDAAVAVRSSATAEDLPDASFAGQQETFLNIRGETALLEHRRIISDFSNSIDPEQTYCRYARVRQLCSFKERCPTFGRWLDQSRRRQVRELGLGPTLLL